jgi:cell division protein FtsN
MANRDSFDDFENDDQDDGFLTFDARDEEEDRSRGPLVIAAIVAVLAICGIILWQLYQGGKDSGETPQIAADTGSFKAAPAQTDAAPTDDLDKGVFDAADGNAAPPLDVQPATSGAEDPLLADGGAVPAPAPAVRAQQTAAATVPVPRPAPVAVAKPVPAPVTRPTAAPIPKPVVKSPPAQVAQVKPKTAPAPAPAPVAVPKATPTPIPVPATVKAEATPAPAPRPAASSGIAAQLGSFQTRASADTALARYRASGLSGPVSVVAADLGAKGTWYRIRATGFDSRAEVDSFCGKARSAGAQCIPSGGR